MSYYGITYIAVIEIQSPGQLDLERDLIELAKRYPRISWQMGPREINVSSKVAMIATKLALEEPRRDD